MIKRLICLIIILAVCFSFAACASCDSSGTSGESVESQAASEDSSEGDDSEQDSSSSASGGAQGEGSASQSEGGGAQSDSDDNSGSDSDSDDSDADGANSGSGANNNGGGTSGTQTGAGTGSGQSGFAITKQPIGGAYTAGSTVTLSVTATTNSGNALGYQWFTSLAGTGAGAIAIQGATGSAFNVNTSNNSNQYYYCRVTDTRGGQTYVINSNVINVSVTGANNAPAPTPVSYNLWIGGVQVTSANAANVLGDGTVSYNGATNILTLNSANIQYNGTTDNKSPIHADLIYLTINLTGNSTVKSTGGQHQDETGTANALAAIYSTGAITIAGPGAITATGGDIVGVGGHGIYAGGGLTIRSGTINAAGGVAQFGSRVNVGGYGISTPSGMSVTIWGGTINATGGEGGGTGGTGISALGGLNIFDSPTVSAKGGDGTVNFGGYGIYTEGDIILGFASNQFNGSLTAISGISGDVRKIVAFNENVATSHFGTGMKYYTLDDTYTIWSAPIDLDTTALPQDQNTSVGVHFGASSPS